MDATNIYDFLHLLSLIKIIPNMDFGGIWYLHIYMPQYFLFFLFFSLKESGKRLTSKEQSEK
jgi:hypothetical protein